MQPTLADQFAALWESSNSPPDVFAFLEQHAGSAAAQKLAVLLLDQRERWNTAEPLQVESYLDRIPDLASDPQFKLQLAVGEYQARQNGDSSPRLDEFLTRFADLGDTLRSKLSALDSGGIGEGQPNGFTTTQTFATTVAQQRIGRYRLIRVLGEGAFGRVYLGIDDELQRQVAIKVPTPERFQKPEDAETYLAEARTVARLDHPHIVPVHDVGRTEEGSIYVVSKFIEGRTLATRIKQDRPTPEESARLLATIAEALHHAHQKRLIHRDVKPGNILLEDATGRAYLADFGLAIREEDYLRESRIAGTPAYMSPEQARGEGHRLDGRSDIFSLGVVLYELLTGKRPFRGSTANELLHQVVSVEPVPPRELNASVPLELERICLKALSKRASDRYGAAAELADDLLHWQQGPQQDQQERPIVPKGLRSFDANDADFFLDLIPGPRDREGLPESIRFWKTRLEETDADETFSVGLIYGPSGCGKSSLVKAGLLPRLSQEVVAVYVEATPDDTETRILRGLRKQLPDLPGELRLVETFTLLRRGAGRKIVIVLDQFEQWLHAHRAEQETDLVNALRQCDGGRLQAVVMVRDDFAMAASRFMQELESRILEGHNFATVDLFDVDHAQKVLIKFGQAFGKLPAQLGKLSDQEREFVGAVATGLANDGKVVSVRLALFADMVKGKPWIPATLEEVGGTEGIGVNFLEETFVSRSANPNHRLHQAAAREVLKSLLPEVGSDIKGHMRSHAELQSAAGYAQRPSDFNDLLRILDGELRLITPTDPEGFQTVSGSDPSSKYYQLTHDYLVPSLRDWLTRKQRETRKGRAELRLAERSATWNSKPERRYLPSLWEYLSIASLTPRKNWTGPQRKMMGKAGRYHGLWSAGLALLLLLGAISAVAIGKRVEERQNATRAEGMVDALVSADTPQVPEIVKQLGEYARWADPLLTERLAQAKEGSTEKLHLSLALAGKDGRQVEYLYEQLLRADAARFPVIRDALADHQAGLTDRLWAVLSGREADPEQRRLRAAGALAKYDPKNAQWNEVAPEVAGQLVAVNPAFIGSWQEALRPVADRLVPPLAKIFADPEQSELPRTLATSLLADYAKDDPQTLTNLVLAADAKAFAALFPVLRKHEQAAVEKLQAILAGKAEPNWHDPPLDPTWVAPPPATRAAIEAAHGMLAERFAFCQDLPWAEFPRLAEALRSSGYRPTRVRPWRNGDKSLVAAIWARDGHKWELQADLALAELPKSGELAEKEGLVPADVVALPAADATAERRFALLWSEPAQEGEQRRLLVDFGETVLKTMEGQLVKQGFIAQATISVWTDAAGQRRYAGIWSNQGAPSESNPAYAGFELVDQPQWDVAVAPAELPKLADPLAAFREQLAAIEKLPAEKQDDPKIRQIRATAHYQLAHLEPALADLDFLIGKEITTPAILRSRALTLARLGKGEEAQAGLAQYLASDATPSQKRYAQIQIPAWLKDFDEASRQLEMAAIAEGQTADDLYDVACAAALCGLAAGKQDAAPARKFTDRALELLQTCVDRGYANAKHLKADPDLAGLHGEPRFTALLEKLEPPSRFAAVWRADVEFESKLLSAVPLDKSLADLKSLLALGYRPFALTVDSSSASSFVLHRPLVPDTAQEKLALEQAAAAVTLLRMNAPDHVWPLFQHHSDPRLRSYLLSRLAAYGVEPSSLLAQLPIESDVSRRRALILGLGQFAREKRLSAEQQAAVIADLAQRYGDDPDPGVHGAAEWALRQLGAEGEIAKVRAAYSTGKAVGERRWYLTKSGATPSSAGSQAPGTGLSFTIIEPDEFLMGSPVVEAERFQGPTGQNEIRHRRRIGRRFAIGMHEVTVAQFQAFRGDHQFDRTKARESDAPANMITWYDAAAYCNWLSKEEGIPPDQWCYDPQQKFAEGMTLYLDYLKRTGYRLPTEAEWEYACRAGAATARYFGESETLLGEYAWYTKTSGDKWVLSVGSLKPNDNGLFDMQGNVLEWCQDQALFFAKNREWLGDPEQVGKLVNSESRVLRGGSLLNNAPYVRSANRNSSQPNNRNHLNGFRPARTYPFAP